MSFPRYPKYKPSGVEWLGKVPEHWEVCALKRIISMQSGESITAESIEESGHFPVFGGGGLRGYTSSFTHDGHFALIGRQGALCGNINYGRGKFWASEHAVVASPIKQVEIMWLGEMMRAMNLNQYSVSAAQPGLSVDLVGRVVTVLPPLSEQTAIAALLDTETAKIDELVAEQRRLMDLLKEKRQAVISHAVTKGLNPNAPMKSSGIEWLGDVPEHWEVTRLKYLVANENHAGIQTGPFGGMLTGVLYQDDGEFKVYGQENVLSGDFEKGIRWIPGEQFEALSNYRANSGDLLFTRKGSIGGCCRFPDTARSGIIDSDTIRVSLKQEAISHDFLLLAFKFSQYQEVQIQMMKRGAILSGLNSEVISNLIIIAPPILEQFAIVTYLNTESSKFDTLTVEAQRAIDLLQERRTALISAAVTGQIDVRADRDSFSEGLQRPPGRLISRQRA